MRKALRIITVTAGIISVVSALVLGCIYLEDIFGHIGKIKNKFFNKLDEPELIDDYNEPEIL